MHHVMSSHVEACHVMCNVMPNHWFVFSPVLLLTLWVAVVGSAAPGAAEQVGLEEGGTSENVNVNPLQGL